MPIDWPLVSVIALVVSTGVGFSIMLFLGRKVRSKFEHRDSLKIETLYSRCHESKTLDMELFRNALVFLSDSYQIDVSKLRLEDSFKDLRMLRPLFYWDIETDIEEYVMKHQKIQKPLKHLITIKDFVVCVSRVS